jgi:putative Holliday junction resolvase
VRLLGVDLGLRRIGLAVSDPSGSLARPWKTIAAAATPAGSADLVATAVTELIQGDGLTSDGERVEAIVVGLPQRLGGGDTHLTEVVRAFATVLSARTGLAVHLQDERLTSHAADEQLRERERDWRKRKAQIDAAAAAIILQDNLDGRAGGGDPSHRAGATGS